MPLFLVTALVLTMPPDDKPAAKVNFTDNVAAIFQAKCNSCHNSDKKKGGLSLESFSTLMQGGGSGKVVEPGDSANSRLFLLVSHQEEPKMPPMSAKLPDNEIAVIKQWIDAGAPESSGSAVAMKAKPKLDFKLDPAAMGKPQGAPAMPEGIETDPLVVSSRANAITAIAASPWAPLVAVAGHKQVLLYNPATQRLLGVLPFPEGVITSLKFTRDGAMLLAGGGRGGQSGKAVAWDVKSGKRLFEVGKEYDTVLAADISPDRSLVALGGPSKILRVYNTSDGELAYESKKHTEWITAVEFSPDGVLLASGDRNGGLVVWEANTGREFYDLRGHGASITDVCWRLDSNVLASASEDTTVRLWEMQNGGQIKSWGAHGGGAASVRFAKDGRIVTTGRDRAAKLWDQNGAALRTFEAFGDLALHAVFTHDDAAVVAGDFSGEVRVFELKEGKRVGNLRANPEPLEARLSQARQALGVAQAAADAAAKELAALQASAKATGEGSAKAQADLAAGQKAAADATAAYNAAEADWIKRYEVESAASDLAYTAEFHRYRAQDLRGELMQMLRDRTDAQRTASYVAAQTGNSRDRLIADRAVADLAGAVKSSEPLLREFAKLIEASPPLRLEADKAAAARTQSEAALPAVRLAADHATDAVPALQTALTNAIAAKAGADKAVADKSPQVQALAAKAVELKAEVDSLAAEKDAKAKRAVASAAVPPSN